MLVRLVDFSFGRFIGRQRRLLLPSFDEPPLQQCCQHFHAALSIGALLVRASRLGLETLTINGQHQPGGRGLLCRGSAHLIRNVTNKAMLHTESIQSLSRILRRVAPILCQIDLRRTTGWLTARLNSSLGRNRRSRGQLGLIDQLFGDQQVDVGPGNLSLGGLFSKMLSLSLSQNTETTFFDEASWSISFPMEGIVNLH